MDAVIKKIPTKPVKRPSQEEAEAAVRTLLAWAGDNPDREGLLDTPKRVVKAFREYFSGYEEDPAEALSRTFEDVGGYDDIVMLRDIEFNSHCEHHIAPFVGRVHVAYLPTRAVVGISKLARVVEIYARRLPVSCSCISAIHTSESIWWCGYCPSARRQSHGSLRCYGWRSSYEPGLCTDVWWAP